MRMKRGFIIGIVFIVVGICIFAYYEINIKSEMGAREYLRRAKLSYERGTKESINRSIDIFGELIAKYPDTNSAVEAFYYIGKCYENLGLNRLAYLKYVYLLKNNTEIPDNIKAELRTRIARLRVMRNYSEEGVHQLLDLLRYTNNRDFRSRVYTELGHAYLKMGEFKKSNRMFDIALSENGSNEDALLGKARSFKRIGYDDKAYDLYEQFLKYNGNFSQYTGDVKKSFENQLYWSGYYSYVRGKYWNAISYFSRYLRNFSDYNRTENVLYLIGECYYSARNYDKAILYFNKTLSNSYTSRDQDARIKKGYIYFLSKKFDLAAREFQIYINDYPNGRHISTAKKWKDMSTKEILYRIKNRSLPEDNYDMDQNSYDSDNDDSDFDDKDIKNKDKKIKNKDNSSDNKDVPLSGDFQKNKGLSKDNVAEL